MIKIFDKVKDHIWAMRMTIKTIRKYGVHGADKFTDRLLHRERMKYWKATGKHWKDLGK